MTRVAYDRCVPGAAVDRLGEVRRLLDRYLVEIVEAYDLCPWARPARLGGELAVEVLWGAPDDDDFVFHAEQLLMREETRVAMIVAPELLVTPAELHAIRDHVVSRVPSAGVADFHPEAPLDLVSPARLVPFLRRSPDPLLQLVPLELLRAVRASPPVADLATQAAILRGTASPPRADVADAIAATNHTRVLADTDAITATLEAIAADRRTSYARAGIEPRRRTT
jgi:hypothetical protein